MDGTPQGQAPPRPVRDVADVWPVTASSTPFTGTKTGVRVDRVRMPDGSEATREYQTHPGSVGVLALDDHQRVAVIQQYRHPVRARLWELPAGLLDEPGESPLRAAQRELYEEVHLRAARWRVLTDTFSSPGGCDEAVRLYLAQELSQPTEERYTLYGEEADLLHAWVPVPELVSGVLGGTLRNSLLAVGVLALQAALARDGGLAELRPPQAPWSARPFRPTDAPDTDVS